MEVEGEVQQNHVPVVYMYYAPSVKLIVLYGYIVHVMYFITLVCGENVIINNTTVYR